MSRRKREIQQIRATEAERESWRAAAEASGLTISDYVRRAIATAEVGREPRRRPRPKPRRVDPALVEQVRRIGENVNQITKWLNTHGVRFTSQKDILEIKLQLSRIEDNLDALIDQQRDKNSDKNAR